MPICLSAVVGAVSTTVEKRVGKRHRLVKQVSVTFVPKTQVLPIPQNIVLSDAHMVSGATVGDASKGRATYVTAHSFSPAMSVVLVLFGLRLTGSQTISGWKGQTCLSSIPPFLTENLIGKAAFSGNDLILTIGSSQPTTTGKQQPQSSGYRVALKFVGGKFYVDGKANNEGPCLYRLAICSSCATGENGSVKGWLVDSRLISIPKYIGLNKTPGQPFKLIGMANPGTGISRFRLVTFAKDDLILDIGKVKNQMAIKGLFVAKPDPLAEKLLGTVPAADKAAEAQSANEASKSPVK